jgi:2-methylcitrate dehydratase PrpD
MEPHALIAHLCNLRMQAPACTTIERAQHCLLDWLGVAIAGSHEPAARQVIELVCRDCAGGDAYVIGAAGRRACPTGAALANGMSGHILDLDDVHLRFLGHPSAAIMPAALALAGRTECSGAAMIMAIIVGAEAACRLGDWMGAAHYAAGWHATATLGTFAAAAAACCLLNLDENRWRDAFNLAACRAAGLQAAFGSDAKPYQVGKAAADGLEASLLAAAGLRGSSRVFDDARGFRSLYDGAECTLEASTDTRPCIESVTFKYHASCFGTHAVIEAARAVRERRISSLEAIRHVQIAVPPRYLDICNIAEPNTPAEAKFSLRFMCALGLAGGSTIDPGSFSAATVQEPQLRSLCRRIEVLADTTLGNAAARVTVRFAAGQGHLLEEAVVDLSEPESDTSRQSDRLGEKFSSIVTPSLGAQRAQELIIHCQQMFEAPSVIPLLELAAA